jgi:ketosteroid isomerase-like protein
MKSFTKTLILILPVLTIALVNCESTKNARPINKTINVSGNELEIKKKIEKITQSINKAVLENDYDTQLKYFTENAIIVPPLGPVANGKNAIKDGFERNIKENVVVHSFNATIEDLWVSDNRVYERGKWAMAQSTSRSKIPKAYYGSYFEIWKTQQDSSLLIDYMIYTLGFNPFEEK